MNKVKIALYTCEDSFETDIQTICLKGDTLYIGYLTKDSELIKFKKYV